MACLWDYIGTSDQSTRGGSGGSREGDRGQRQGPSDTLQLFERGWPVLPVTMEVGSRPSRELLTLRPRMPVVYPPTNGARLFNNGDCDARLTNEAKKVSML